MKSGRSIMKLKDRLAAENAMMVEKATMEDEKIYRNIGELKELLSWVGLRAQANALPPQLSGGERQRAALALAVMTSPEVILADEPTGNLDWEMSLRLLSLLVELNRMGKTVVIATHDLNLIRQAKQQVQARVLRIAGRRLHLAGADL